MIVFRIARSKYVNDLSGKGARLYGGRWNSVGIPALYTSSSISLAFLELLANMDLDDIPVDLSIATIEFEGDPFIPKDIPEGWDSYWPSPVSQLFGDALLKKEVAFEAHSLVVPQEINVIFSPVIRDFNKIVRILKTESFNMDVRFKKMLRGN